MPAYRIKRRAEKDLREIALYTMRTWGRDQTVRYRRKLEESFELLSSNPSLGRHCDSILPGLRRFEVGKHVIFFQYEPHGVAIARILHQKMLPFQSRFEA
jgi:toxin ParE1/3/4